MNNSCCFTADQWFWSPNLENPDRHKTSGSRQTSVTGSVIVTRYSNTRSWTCEILYYFWECEKNNTYSVFSKYLAHAVFKNVYSSKSISSKNVIVKSILIWPWWWMKTIFYYYQIHFVANEWYSSACLGSCDHWKKNTVCLNVLTVLNLYFIC